ncbi:MFS transporter [Bacillus sp. NPDC077027]|uniref:MFS transporter n=1 Tax=Bacillus sp. NPDC077027 TaxID=3390548 RepID=UPI003D009F89
MKNPYMKTASGMYVNYFLLGMVNIILASNMPFLTKQLHTDSAGISFIISALGIGRVLTYGISGVLSDRFGRKPVILVSGLLMAVFLIGIPLSPSYQVAFIFAILAGIANSAMDAGTYPALMESFPQNSGSANVIVKAFISIGATLLPFAIFFLAEHDLFYGYAFFIPALIYLVNVLFLWTLPFPNHRKIEQVQVTEHNAVPRFSSEPTFWREGIALIVISFTSNGLYALPQIWLPTYGEEILELTSGGAVKLLSYYSMGGLLSVLLLAWLLRRFIRPVTILLVYPMITLISIFVLLVVKSPVIGTINAFVLGFSTAGVFQLTLTVMAEFFWKNKGTMTGIISTAGGVSAIVIPVVTGLIKSNSTILQIFMFDAVITVIAILGAIYIFYRYRRIMIHE